MPAVVLWALGHKCTARSTNGAGRLEPEPRQARRRNHVKFVRAGAQQRAAPHHAHQHPRRSHKSESCEACSSRRHPFGVRARLSRPKHTLLLRHGQIMPQRRTLRAVSAHGAPGCLDVPRNEVAAPTHPLGRLLSPGLPDRRPPVGAIAIRKEGTRETRPIHPGGGANPTSRQSASSAWCAPPQHAAPPPKSTPAGEEGQGAALPEELCKRLVVTLRRLRQAIHVGMPSRKRPAN